MNDSGIIDKILNFFQYIFLQKEDPSASDLMKIENLIQLAEAFRATAEKVNESCRHRKEFALTALDYVEKSHKIGRQLLADFEKLGKVNESNNKHYHYLLSSCGQLRQVLESMAAPLEKLRQRPELNQIQKLHLSTNKFIEAVKKAFALLNGIVQANEQLADMEQQILNIRKKQKESTLILKGLSAKSLADAQKAESGSAENLRRGKAMLLSFHQVPGWLAGNEISSLQQLVLETQKGWQLANEVYESSQSQYSFAQEVKTFTKDLYERSIVIKEKVQQKHALFRSNLEPFSELAVLVAVEFQEFDQNRSLMQDLKGGAKDGELGSQDDLSQLLSLSDEVIELAKKIAEANYDQTEIIAQNAQVEHKALELTQKEQDYYAKIEKQVSAMTEATRFPIEGSQRNIDHGKTLEIYLYKIMKAHSLNKNNN